jgi:hypothetical protein
MSKNVFQNRGCAKNRELAQPQKTNRLFANKSANDNLFNGRQILRNPYDNL